MRKKLQQLHNEAAQKRFTTFIALLVMLLFAIGGSLQVQAQDNNTNGTPITGIESLTGCSEDQVRAAAISDNTFPDEKDKIFSSTMSRRVCCSMQEAIGELMSP